jgi:hypothetical protein
MKPRSIAAAAAGALLVGAALLFIPVRAAASGAETADHGPKLLDGDFLAGYDGGLYRLKPDGSSAEPLWTEGEVRKILRSPSGWYLLSSKGVLFSADLKTFANRSAGLPVKTYKVIRNGAKDFILEVQDLKDLESDPANPDRILTCTKDEVFLSDNGGQSWKSLGAPVATTGLKAVAFGPIPGSVDQGIWASHPIKGLFVRRAAGGAGWLPVTQGLAPIPGTTSMEEVADMVPSAQGFWASNSFLPRIYRWLPEAKSFRQVFAAPQPEGSVESLSPLPDGSLRFVTDGGVKRLDPTTGLSSADAYASKAVELALGAKPDWQLLSLSFPEAVKAGPAPQGASPAPAAQLTTAAAAGSPAPAALAPPLQSGLSELWLVSFKDRKPYRAAAENHQGLYLATGFMIHEDTRQKYFSLMKSRGLDSVVVDMKDDFGRLRFDPRDPLLRTMGRTSSPMDIEAFVKEAKARGIWLVARVVVFKDQVVYDYAGGKYAVWDAAAKAPWQGYNNVKPPAPAPAAAPSGAPSPYGPPAAAAAASPAPAPATVREPIKEYWVDPYSEEVWAYNVAIANEIIARGFDEVQFDYIRFPTDGANIDEASFRWRDPGMDKESALASFLRFARENIKAPISIDIYGANGWFRSGVRTGQDVELLAKYVDVICPMYYPSHFEQGFLAQPPAEDRPYRIYRIGTFRTSEISRRRVVVRPYVQAFYMNVSYDRTWYNLDYVKREVAGIRDSLNLGMTFWNNSGRYDDIPVLQFGADGRLSGPGLPATTRLPAGAATPPAGAASPPQPSGTASAGTSAAAEASSGLLD